MYILDILFIIFKRKPGVTFKEESVDLIPDFPGSEARPLVVPRREQNAKEVTTHQLPARHALLLLGWNAHRDISHIVVEVTVNSVLISPITN